MRCQSCNAELTDFEATRKHAVTGEYIDLCNVCFRDVKSCIPVLERYDLETEVMVEEEEFIEIED